MGAIYWIYLWKPHLSRFACHRRIHLQHGIRASSLFALCRRAWEGCRLGQESGRVDAILYSRRTVRRSRGPVPCYAGAWADQEGTLYLSIAGRCRHHQGETRPPRQECHSPRRAVLWFDVKWSRSRSASAPEQTGIKSTLGERKPSSLWRVLWRQAPIFFTFGWRWDYPW